MVDKQNNVLVTGAGGLIGRAVVERLSKRYAVMAIEREARNDDTPNVYAIEMDVTSD